MMNKETKEKALVVARALLSGQISAIEACWTLSSLVDDLAYLISPDDCNLFVGVQSESDALPVGILKENWHSDFLPPKLEQLAKYEAAVSKNVQDACKRLIVSVQAKQ